MQKPISTYLPTLLVPTLSLLLAGCSTGFAPNGIQTDRSSIGSIQGAEHGGQAPISGAQIYLYAAGTGGYGSLATSLLQAGGSGLSTTYPDLNGNYYVLTDADGNFNLSGDYTCTVGTQVYMVAVGGNPGLTPGKSNPYIVQMAGLGQCPASGNLAAQVPYLVINEVSTVAFAYSMGGFATNAYNVSSSGTALAQTGIANAMLNTGNIVNIQYGQAPTVANGNPNSVVPESKIYTLANILAACVNADGTNSQPTQCSNLFADATSDGTITGTKATNEAEAIFNIVHHPTSFVSALFSLQPSVGTAFQPSLSQAPTDWTLPIVYRNAISVLGTDSLGNVNSGPFSLAADTAGDVWIGDEVRGVVELGPQGALSTYNPGFTQIKGVAVSPLGSIWAADAGSNTMYLLDTTGAVTVTTPGNGMNGPAGIAFDALGDASVDNLVDNSISKFGSDGSKGAPPQAHFFQGGQVSGPAGIAVDSNGNAYVPSQNSTYLGKLAPGNGNTKGKEYNIFIGSYALTLDAADNIWIPGSLLGLLSPSLYKVTCTTSSCSIVSTVGNQGGMNSPDQISLDGGGVLWIGNQGSAVVSAYNTTTGKWLASSGFTTGTSGYPLNAIPDGSGNIWTSNSDGTVSQILGLATPTATPLIPSNFGVKP